MVVLEIIYVVSIRSRLCVCVTIWKSRMRQGRDFIYRWPCDLFIIRHVL